MNIVVLLKQFNLEGRHALDLGAGTGHLSLAMANSGASVISVDKDEVALSKFSHANITKISSDVARYVIEPKSFDLIIARNILPFLGQNLERVFQNMVIGLKSDGKLFFSFFGERDEWRSKPNIKCLSENEIIELLKKHGLKVHYQETEEGIAPTMAGSTKYWHVLSYLLIK